MTSAGSLSIWSKRYRKQILVTVVAHIITFTHGISLGWLSPIIQVLQSPDSPLSFTITTEQVSWIGSLFGIGFLVGNIFFGLTLDRLGRKLNMYLLAIPHMLFWILSYAAQSINYLYAARFFAGFTSSGMYVVIPIFISELSDKEIRGALTAMAMGFLSTGIYLDMRCQHILIIFSLPKREESVDQKYNRDLEHSQPTMPIISEFDELKAAVQSGGLATPITIKDFLKRSFQHSPCILLYIWRRI
ncbi:unnamed protein product [Ceratitis capitata]|uniref:(Mediterranean fruit fly) hypothetical protein n=1 Tax=Ceratitis capitata TaxID=7213 RepID=A0A811UCL6_CERCA|nr:unnamed protein product [Ceratitis capitata]